MEISMNSINNFCGNFNVNGGYLNIPDGRNGMFNHHSAPNMEHPSSYGAVANEMMNQNHLSDGFVYESSHGQHNVFHQMHYEQPHQSQQIDISSANHLPEFSSFTGIEDGYIQRELSKFDTCMDYVKQKNVKDANHSISEQSSTYVDTRPNELKDAIEFQRLLDETIDHNRDSGIDLQHSVSHNTTFDNQSLYKMDFIANSIQSQLEIAKPSLSAPLDEIHQSMWSPDLNIPNELYHFEEKVPDYGWENIKRSDRSCNRNRPPTSFKSSSSVSRTNLKLSLQREQVQEQERREQIQRSTGLNASLSSKSIGRVATAVAVPTTNTKTLNQQNLPKEVLTVHTRLENPTHYHVIAKQQRQVQEFLNTSRDDDERRVVSAQSLPVVESVVNVSGPYMSSSAPSPDSPNSAALSSSAATSVSDADVIESIMQLQTEIDEGNGYIQMSTMPATGSSLLETNLYKLNHQNIPSAKSCPTEVTSLTPIQMEQFQKERIKKDNHNMIERRRRYNINDRIKELATLLPKSNDPHRQNKGTILKESVDYIKKMNKLKDEYLAESQQRKRLEQENKKLKLLTQQLLMQLTVQVPTLETSLVNEVLPNVNLIVKQEPMDNVVECELPSTIMADLMDDDGHPVNGDPMLNASNDEMHDEMDYMS